MDFTKVQFDMIGDVARVRLNDPATLNAMSGPMGQELLTCVQRSQRTARALLIGSVGRAFCSGANLAEGGLDIRDPDRDAGTGLEKVFNPLIMEIRGSRIPIVTAIRGAAAGVGCGIALSGDLIVAGEGAFFYQAFCRVGLTPDGGSSYFLARAIGRVRAMEMMLLGDKLPATKALDWGLINRVVPDDQVDDAALELATQLSRGPRSLGLIRQSAWTAVDAPLAESLQTERANQREASRTEDFVEGVMAFREKRPAQFRGR